MDEIILALIAVIGPIISGIIAYRQAVKKSETELEAVKIQTKHEIEKIREQAASEAKLYEERTKMDFITKQLSNPTIQKVIDRELKKQFGK